LEIKNQNSAGAELAALMIKTKVLYFTAGIGLSLIGIVVIFLAIDELAQRFIGISPLRRVATVVVGLGAIVAGPFVATAPATTTAVAGASASSGVVLENSFDNFKSPLAPQKGTRSPPRSEATSPEYHRGASTRTGGLLSLHQQAASPIKDQPPFEQCQAPPQVSVKQKQQHFLTSVGRWFEIT